MRLCGKLLWPGCLNWKMWCLLLRFCETYGSFAQVGYSLSSVLCNLVNVVNCSKQQLLYTFLITHVHMHVHVHVHRHVTHACIHSYTHTVWIFLPAAVILFFFLEVLIPSQYRFPFPNYSLSSSLIRPAFYLRRFPRNSQEHPRLGRSLGIYTCKLSVSFANVNVTYKSGIFEYIVQQLGCQLLFCWYTVLTHVTLVLGKSVSIFITILSWAKWNQSLIW